MEQPQDSTGTDVREGKATVVSKTDEVKLLKPLNDATLKADEAGTKTHERSGDSKKGARKSCSKKHKKKKKISSKKPAAVEDDSSDITSDDEDTSSASEDSDSDSSESELEESRKKRSTKKRHEEVKTRKKKPTRKAKKPVSPSDSGSGDSDSSEEEASDSDSSVEDNAQQNQQNALLLQLQQLQATQALQLGNQYPNNAALGTGMPQMPVYNPPIRYPTPGATLGIPPTGVSGVRRRLPPPRGLGKITGLDGLDGKKRPGGKHEKKRNKSSKLDYKRVDQVWDNTIHNYKLQDTAESATDAQYEEYLFHVRRTFDWEGKYKTTMVDIKSKSLRECLQDVIGNIKGLSLVEDTPKMDPNMLFLYLDDLKEYYKGLKKAKPKGDSKQARKKDRKKNETKQQHLKVLLKYINKDYAKVKESLYPMLKNGLITFDLLWALWKPNTLAYTSTYGSHDQPRIFKVEMAEQHYSIMKGNFYYIEGKYFEYDGKQHGFGNMAEELGDFRRARKITSLSCYPLEYHRNEAKLREELIERGKKFVALSGVHYKSHQGMAYYKKKKSIIKVNINGRIMVDPSIHRRINPNYPISLVRPKDHDVLDDDGSDEESACGCGSDSEEDEAGGGGGGGGGGERELEDADDKPKYVTKVYKDEKGKIRLIRMPKEEADEAETKEKLDQVQSQDEKNGKLPNQQPDSDESTTQTSDKKVPEFTDEEYLIASPVVLGFAFAEKLWLEFTVSGVKEISWNEKAYESLVLEPKTKDIVKALVESHKYHAAESIDDVIQGKGKGLVAILHGPPGTGKTLTAEGISELLKCPLYMVSAGELGTDSRYLEAELQKILDICHAWGAILLLDEADVFLEKRNMQDIHRNALVSIFLRQLEYFQGILFLTTNRVETFDDAFQSRIHIALRYDALDQRAKKAIFKIFVERVRVLEGEDLSPFKEEDYDSLARHELNGRQIKNTIRTAQALAVNKGEALSMSHIRQVLDVQMNFDRDLKGGTGYQDAMRSYF